jgi:nucleotide-binding universal stress UspA family protein
VALLSLSRDARITLLHVVPKLLPRDARSRAESDARKALQLAGRRLASKLRDSVKVVTTVKAGGVVAEITRHARSSKAELVVMGRGGGSALRDMFLGSTAERVLRRSQLPTLVVRRPAREVYLSPWFALDADSPAHGILALALRVLPAPRPQLGLVHAYDAPYHSLRYPSFSSDLGREERSHYRQTALHEMARTLATALVEGKASSSDALSWKSHIQYGSPRTVISNTVARTGADLLVLGTHGYTGLAHALLGSVAGEVLREVPCDVLVVPLRSQAASRRGEASALQQVASA